MLREQEDHSDNLSKCGFAASVGAGHDVNAVVARELKVVAYDIDLLTLELVDRELEVVDSP